MKRKLIFLLLAISVTALALVACTGNTNTENTPAPTAKVTVLPTVAPEPTAVPTVVPTVEPTVEPTTTPTVDPNAPLAAWNLTEGTGNIITDYSENEYDLYMNGSWQEDDNFTSVPDIDTNWGGWFANDKTAPFLNLENSFTMSFWIKVPENHASFKWLMADMFPANIVNDTWASSWEIYIHANGCLILETKQGTDKLFYGISGPNVNDAEGDTITTGQWTNVSLTFNSQTRMLTSYINGTQANQTQVSDLITMCQQETGSVENVGFIIGGRADLWNGPCIYPMAYVRLYEKELSASEINFSYRIGDGLGGYINLPDPIV